jgi:hypothetical protein
MRNTLFTLGFVGLSMLFGCGGDGGGLFGGGGNCGNELTATDEFFSFKLCEEGTEKNLLGIQGIYNSDTVGLYNQNWEKISEERIRNDGRIAFAPALLSEISLDSVYVKEFYLYLNYKDTDTLKITYELKPNDGNCPKPDLDYMEVYFNGKFIHKGIRKFKEIYKQL